MLMLTGAIFWAGWHWRGVKEQFAIVNLALHAIQGQNSKQDEDIKDLYAKWDRVIENMVTKKDLDRLMREGKI